jgi:hypothetical protein
MVRGERAKTVRDLRNYVGRLTIFAADARNHGRYLKKLD